LTSFNKDDLALPPFIREKVPYHVEFFSKEVFFENEERSRPFSFHPVSQARIFFTNGTKPEGTYEVKAFHSNIVEKVNPYPPKADGLYTFQSMEDKPLTMSINTADCLSVGMVCEKEGKVFASLVHAGWRGFTSNILGRALQLAQEAFNPLSPSDIYVFIAPSIFGSSYECGLDVYEALEGLKKEVIQNYPFFTTYEPLFQESLVGPKNPSSQKIHPDLQMLAVFQLLSYGLPPQNLTLLRENTYGHPFFASYRQACQTQGDKKKRHTTHLSV
jgi:copper oxidase (laccase) domain-containing protein